MNDGDAASLDRRLLQRTRRRLVLWSGGITLVILVVLGSAVWLAVSGMLQAEGEDRLRQRADILRDMIATSPPISAGAPRGVLPIGLGFGRRASGTFAVLVLPDDRALVPDDLAALGIPVAAAVEAARSGAVDIRTTTVGEVPVRLLTMPVDRGSERYVVQVIGDRSDEEQLLGVLLLVLAVGGLVALVLALGGGALYAERALVPIRESLRRQRGFAADASHEFRTPLTVIRGSVDHLCRHPTAPVASVGTALGDIDAEVDHLARLVDDLLLLARADSGAVVLQRESVDLADVAASALGGLATLASERPVRLELDAGPTVVTGDAVRLRQLVTILVDNAIRHSPPGADVRVAVRPERKEAVLQVHDAGPGIRTEDQKRVFERFWRAADAPPGGAGLGLSIAAWIAGRHDGAIRVLASPAGGARIEVRLPLRVDRPQPRIGDVGESAAT